MTASERFWKRVDKTGECWVWTGGRFPNGYGAFWLRGRQHQAHRVAYELAFAPVPSGLCVLHHCDNRPCVRPAHLFIGTASANMRDMIRKGRWCDRRGSKHPLAKLTEDMVAAIRARSQSGETQSALAADYHLSQSAVSLLVARKRWRHI